MDGFVRGPNEGTSYSFLGGDVRAVAVAEETGIGSFSVETFPPGFTSPLHVHRRDAGVFFLIDGTMRIRCGESEHVALAGSTIFLPAGVPHAFRVEGDRQARWFSVQSPFGDFVAQAKAQVDGRPGPVTAGGHAAIERLPPKPFPG